MSTAATGVSVFDGKKYLSLESYRKNGNGVRTVVWFPASPADEAGAATPKFFAYTTATSGKVKRIRRTGAVRIAPCDARGTVSGPWLDAHAEIVAGEEFRRGMELLDRKYRPWKQLLDLFAMLSRNHQRVMLAIRPV